MKRLAVACITILAATSARAEVCAVFNPAGEFVRLDVITDEGRGLIWTKFSSLPDNTCLNLEGDLIGDQLPTHTAIMVPDEPLVDHRHLGPDPDTRLTPVVAWPRNDGNDWEIIYAMWDYESNRWSTAAYVDRVENFADDIYPLLRIVDDKLNLLWEHRTPTEVLTMGSDGTVLSLGSHHDILWSPPYIVALGPLAESFGTFSPGGDTSQTSRSQP